MLRKTLVSLSLIASAPLSANDVTTINNVIDTAQSIRNTFATGIKFVGGSQYYAGIGGIAPSGMATSAFITKAQQDAYNQAVMEFKVANLTVQANADEYFQQQAQDGMNNLGAAVDAYVAAAGAIIEVAVLQEMAIEASQSSSTDNNQQAIEVQEYIEANEVNVLLDDAETETYNDALVAVEDAAQKAAAFMAVANDPELLENANTQAEDMQVVYADAADSFFDAASGTLTISWVEENKSVSLAVNSYFKSTTDILTAGEQSDFYKTSPEGGCFFIQDEVERNNCLAS